MSDLTWYVIYKTTHVETDQFYVGRHQTTNLDDGYQGSGNWVRSFEDTSALVTEVIEYCEDADHLRDREQHYIDLWFDDPLCMNESRIADGHGGLLPGTPGYAKLIATHRSPDNRAAKSKRVTAEWLDPKRRQKTNDYWTDEKREARSAKYSGIPKSKSTRAAMSKAWTAEKRAARSQELTGKPQPKYQRDANSKALSQYWIITVLETSEQIPVHGLQRWCKENNCTAEKMYLVANGKRKSHKGLTCRKVTKEQYQQLVDQLAAQGNSPP